MAIDMFLKLDDVTGEAQDKTNKDQIDILAWSWGMSQSGSTHSGTGSGAGKVNVQDLSITKYVDKSTPTLMLFCCNGKHIKKGKLTIRKAGGDKPVEYVTIDLEDIIVTSVSAGGSGGEDRLTEHVVLNFGLFHHKYFPQTDKGSAGSAVEAKWNIPQNASA